MMKFCQNSCLSYQPVLHAASPALKSLSGFNSKFIWAENKSAYYRSRADYSRRSQSVMIRITSHFFFLHERRWEKNKIPISVQFFCFFFPPVCFVLFAVISFWLLRWRWDITFLICIDMQMLLVTIELLRPVISIGAFVIMCVLPLHVYLLTVSGSCFFFFLFGVCVPCLMDVYCIQSQMLILRKPSWSWWCWQSADVTQGLHSGVILAVITHW